MPKQKSTITKEEEEIRDQLLEKVPNCDFSHVTHKNKSIYVFKSIKGKTYKCPACNKNHVKCGWYAFPRGETMVAGCYSKKFDKKNSQIVIKFKSYVEPDSSSDDDSSNDDSESDKGKYSVMDALDSEDELEELDSLDDEITKLEKEAKEDDKKELGFVPDEKYLEDNGKLEIIDNPKLIKIQQFPKINDAEKRINDVSDQLIEDLSDFASDSESDSDADDESEEEPERKKPVKIKIPKKKSVDLLNIKARKTFVEPKKSKKDLPVEEIPKVDNPFDIYFELTNEQYSEIRNEEEQDLDDDSNGKTFSKYGLTFYNKLFKAAYYNRPEQSESGSMIDNELAHMVAEERIMIRLTINGKWGFACCGPSDVIKILNKEKDPELHEYPRQHCRIFFDLDDKKMEHYRHIHDMYRDLVTLMTIVFHKIRSVKGSNKEFVNEFDTEKLVIHADDHNLNSMHIIYDDKVFRNTAYLAQFMGYIQGIVESYKKKEKTFNEEDNAITESIKRIDKVIDWGVYGTKHSLRTIGSIKKDEYTKPKFEPRKFIKFYYNKIKKKLFKSKKQKITSKDIISGDGSNIEYYMKIPHNAVKKNKKFYQPTDQSLANGLAERFQSFAPETMLGYESGNLFGFNAVQGSPYNCPACSVEHYNPGWYGFMKGNKGFAGCHGPEYKKMNIGGRYLFTLNAIESAKNIKDWKGGNRKDVVRELIKDLEKNGVSKDENGLKKKWSFCDYVQFLRSDKPVPMKDVVEYMHETIIHVIDCGTNRIFTKSYLNDGSIAVKQVRKVFDKDLEVFIDTTSDGKTETIGLFMTYYGMFYNYCSYGYIDFMPFLDKNDGAQLLDKRFNNTFNLFQGYMHDYRKIDCDKVEKEGKLKLIFDHIDLLANRNKEVYIYIILWLAYIIQFPMMKNKVALAFYSKNEQAGKNIFWDWIAMKIFGKELSRSVKSMESLTQRFNKASEGKLFTIGNEISSYNKHKDTDKVKSLVTDTIQEVEPKGFEPYPINDYTAYVFLTNNFNFMKVVLARFLVSPVDESKIGDVKYFTDLAKSMEDNAELFFNYLANIDLTNFQVTKIPMTSMKIEIMEDNLSAPLKFINFLLEMDEEDMYKHLGMIQPSDSDSESESDDDKEKEDDKKEVVTGCIIKDHKRITKKDLYKYYKLWYADEAGEHGHKGSTEFHRELTQNGITSTKNRLTGQKGRPYHINIKFEDLVVIASKFT